MSSALPLSSSSALPLHSPARELVELKNDAGVLLILTVLAVAIAIVVWSGLDMEAGRALKPSPILLERRVYCMLCLYGMRREATNKMPHFCVALRPLLASLMRPCGHASGSCVTTYHTHAQFWVMSGLSGNCSSLHASDA